MAIRDTQKNPAIRAAYKTSRPGLKTIIQKEFDLNIQGGEHSSVRSMYIASLRIPVLALTPVARLDN